jgi:hypothetical protein
VSLCVVYVFFYMAIDETLQIRVRRREKSKHGKAYEIIYRCKKFVTGNFSPRLESENVEFFMNLFSLKNFVVIFTKFKHHSSTDTIR